MQNRSLRLIRLTSLAPGVVFHFQPKVFGFGSSWHLSQYHHLQRSLALDIHSFLLCLFLLIFLKNCLYCLIFCSFDLVLRDQLLARHWRLDVSGQWPSRFWPWPEIDGYNWMLWGEPDEKSQTRTINLQLITVITQVIFDTVLRWLSHGNSGIISHHLSSSLSTHSSGNPSGSTPKIDRGFSMFKQKNLQGGAGIARRCLPAPLAVNGQWHFGSFHICKHLTKL